MEEGIGEVVAGVIALLSLFGLPVAAVVPAVSRVAKGVAKIRRAR